MPDRHTDTRIVIAHRPARPEGWAADDRRNRAWVHDGNRWTRPDSVIHEHDNPRHLRLTLTYPTGRRTYVVSGTLERHGRDHSTVYAGTWLRVG